MLRHDVWVIYPSQEDEGKYVAHSLRTDQVGVAECIVDSLVELVVALRTLMKERRRDPRIDIYCDAPAEVWEMLNHAKPLPKEIEEIAQMRLDGRQSNRLKQYLKSTVRHPRIPRTISPTPELISA